MKLIAGQNLNLSILHSLSSVRRYAEAPAFGVSGYGIRRFTTNVSEMKKLAARDYEDLLQVCINPGTF